MDPRQTRLLVIFGAILLALVSAIVFLEPPTVSGEEPVIGETSVAEVQSLQLHTEEGVLMAQRGPGGWDITAPFTGRGDAQALDDLVSAAGRIKPGESLEDGDPSHYGFDNPRVTLTLEGEETILIEIGSEAPVDNLTYLRIGGGSIFAVEGRQASMLGPPFLLLRDRHVFHLAESAITEVGFSLDGEEWRIILTEGEWQDDQGQAVKHAIVQGALAALTGVLFDGIFEDLDPVEAGLAEPRGAIVIQQEGETHSADVGGEKTGGILLRNHEGVVGTVAEIESLFPTPDQLRVHAE